MREVLAYILLIACSGVWLLVFISIAITGGYQAIEPNPFILYGEILLFVLITGLGIERFRSVFRKKKVNNRRQK